MLVPLARGDEGVREAHTATLMAATAGRATTAESAVMQTLGTAVQLSGQAITFFGLLYALHVTAERLAQWRGVVRSRWTQLRNFIDRWVKQTPPQEPVNVSGTFKGAGQLTAKAEGFPDGTTAGEIVARFDNQLTWLRNHITELAEQLRGEIDRAITAEHKESQAIPTS